MASGHSFTAFIGCELSHNREWIIIVTHTCLSSRSKNRDLLDLLRFWKRLKRRPRRGDDSDIFRWRLLRIFFVSFKIWNKQFKSYQFFDIGWVMWPVGLKWILRVFRPLRRRHSAHKRFWEPRLRFLETARRALQDVLYTFFSKKNQIYPSYFNLPNL